MRLRSSLLLLPAALLAGSLMGPVRADDPAPAPQAPVPAPAPAPAPAPGPSATTPMGDTPDAPLKPAQEVTPEQPIEPPHPNPGVRNQWRYIVIHHSASPSGNAASFDRLHRSKGWDGLAYHFVIDNGKGGPDGRLEVGPRWWKQKHGAHAGALHGFAEDEHNEFNEFGIGICLVGNFQNRGPSRAQLKTLAKLVAKLQADYGIGSENIMGHRHVCGTACPGNHFPWGTLFAMMNEPKPELSRRYPVATREHCPWCDGSDVVASGGPARLNLVRASRTRTDSASELPPPILLRAQP